MEGCEPHAASYGGTVLVVCEAGSWRVDDSSSACIGITPDLGLVRGEIASFEAAPARDREPRRSGP
jgi:hypothetical protein